MDKNSQSHWNAYSVLSFIQIKNFPASFWANKTSSTEKHILQYVYPYPKYDK